MAIARSELYFCGRPFLEHQQYYNDGFLVPEDERKFCPNPLYFKSRIKDEFCCFKILEDGKPYASYFIGVDWLNDDKSKAVYVQPKLNRDTIEEVDYVKMLFSLLRHPETFEFVDEAFEIKWDVDLIEINEQIDHLTPLLVVQYLQVLKRIVRKGLKKSYYKVERNLQAKVKGKVMVSATIKHNLIKNKPVHTYCTFDEFGVNGLENRLLKKTLVFVQRYFNSHNLKNGEGLTTLFNYVNAAFAEVSDEVSLHEVKHIKTNAFYKDYEHGIALARRILKKFGYNITNTEKAETIKTPPFWIDMSKLFELYVLGLLKDKFGSKILYHFTTSGNELDYLYKDGQSSKVIDAKYKLKFIDGINHDDVRQVSGYARLKSVYEALQLDYSEIMDCVIIYPDQSMPWTKETPKSLTETPIEEYHKVYKVGVALPLLEKSTK